VSALKLGQVIRNWRKRRARFFIGTNDIRREIVKRNYSVVSQKSCPLEGVHKLTMD
jgi:hypothetical protein